MAVSVMVCGIKLLLPPAHNSCGSWTSLPCEFSLVKFLQLTGMRLGPALQLNSGSFFNNHED